MVHNTDKMIIERWHKLAGLKLIKEQAGEPTDGPELDDPIEGVWGGDPEGKAGNLELPLDHSKVVKGPGVTPEPETLPNAEPVMNKESVIRLQVYLKENDLGRSCILPPRVYENYFDAWTSGNASRAKHTIERHLDARFPGWSDYEWRR